MKSKLFLTLVAFAGALLISNTFAGELGQAAAPLKIAEWTKGKPVDLAAAKGKQIVVVEFWATWCGPCRQSIPHLTELQKKFKDKGVVFVGVSDEKPDVVKKFVEKMGDKMDYVVAVDDSSKTGAGYMEEFGIRGIPHAFIVDKDSKIVWQGHPMAELEETLTQVVGGKYDVAKAKKRDQAGRYIEQYFELASDDANEAKLDKLAKDIAAIESEVGSVNPKQKFDPVEMRKAAKFQTAMEAYQMALATDQKEKAADLEKILEKNAPPKFELAEFKESIAASKVFGEYMRTAMGQGDASKLPDLAKKVGEVKSKNATMLNEWAWAILTEEGLKKRDLDLALKLAKSAADISESKEAGILDTYARALFDSGKTADAIEQQKKAIAIAEADEKEQLENTLKDYQAKAQKAEKK